MPGPFEVAYLYENWDGGCDVWVGREYNARGQWFAAWHTRTPKAMWWRVRRWRFQAWFFWPNDGVPVTQLTAYERHHLLYNLRAQALYERLRDEEP